jgi:hypothetical protein
VLLVDDQQPEVRHRREHRRAGPHDHARLALPDAPPLVVPLTRRQLAVEDGDDGPEARPRGPHQKRRERDLRHEDQDAAAGIERPFGGPEVHLGLAAARDTVHEEGREAAARNRGQDRREGRRLLDGRHERTLALPWQHVRRAEVALLAQRHGARLRQPHDRAPEGRAITHQVRDARAPAGDAQAGQDLGLGRSSHRRRRPRQRSHLDEPEPGRLEVLHDLHHAGLTKPGEARRRVAPEPMGEGRDLERTAAQGGDHGVGPIRSRLLRIAQARDRAAGADPRRGQDEAHAFARRGQVVVGHPRRQVEQRGRHERGLVQDLDHVLERHARDRLRGSRHDPDRAATSEGNHHPDAARRHRHRLRHAVGEAREHGERKGDGDEPAVHVGLT